MCMRKKVWEFTLQKRKKETLHLLVRLKTKGANLGTHIHRQLGYDLWYVFMGLFIICIVESSKIANLSDYV